MDVDYNAVDTSGGDPLAELRRRILAGLPIVPMSGGTGAQPMPQSVPSTPAVSFSGSPAASAQPAAAAASPAVQPGTPVVSLTNQQPSKPPVLHDSDELPPHERFLDPKDQGVQKAIALGHTPPPSDAGKALYAAGVFDRASSTDSEGKAAGPPAVSLTNAANSKDEAAQGDTPQFADQSAGAARMLAAARSGAGQGGTQSRSAEDEFREALNQEPTRDQFPAGKTSWLRRLGSVGIGALAGVVNPALGVKAGTAFLNRPKTDAEQKFEEAHQTWEGKLGNLFKAATLQHQSMEDKNLQSEIDARSKTKEEKPENLDREAYDDYVSRGMTPADARKRALQDAQSVKPERTTHTSAFEAFAYGDPQEKKAAQDYLEFEKRVGARYKTPSEFDEKFRLFKEDPDTYKAMFGDKSRSGPDPATATKMLSYFDKRRREIQGDFTLDDQQKAQQLQDIENLEKPFMDAVQPDARNGNDRVEVIHPNGQHGTIPRSQLGAAKKKGYREAQSQ
jgi:hypothetical protein